MDSTARTITLNCQEQTAKCTLIFAAHTSLQHNNTYTEAIFLTITADFAHLCRLCDPRDNGGESQVEKCKERKDRKVLRAAAWWSLYRKPKGKTKGWVNTDASASGCIKAVSSQKPGEGALVRVCICALE